MRRILFVVALAATACGDNTAAPDTPAPVIDAGADAPGGPAALAPCLDRPTDLSTTPGQLPCELLPPGFSP